MRWEPRQTADMDYSGLPQDEQSPWNTSPKASAHEAALPTPPLGNSMYSSTTASFPSPAISEGFRDAEAEDENDGPPHFESSQEFPPQTPTQKQSTPSQQRGFQSQQGSQENQQGSLGQQAGNQSAQAQGAQRPAGRPAPQYKLHFKLTALERTGKKDIIIRFDATTNLPKFRSTQFRDVRRTHAEFVMLAEHLISSNPEALVPAVPPPFTSAGAGTDEDEVRVKTSIQKWLNNVSSNQVLIRDDEMIFFVESDFGYSPMKRMKQPATGVKRKVIKQFAPPPDDTPELQEARPLVKLFYLGTMDAGQKMDRLVKTRKDLGAAEADLGVRLAQMNIQETHPGLSSAYRKLGRTIQITGDYHGAQGTAEAATIGDALDYHSNDSFIVKETLTNRHILLRDLIAAQSATRSRLSAADRLKSSSTVRGEKVNEAISALDEARSREEHLGHKTQRVTANLLLEKRRWFHRTAADLRASIREYVVREIEAERRTLANLESVRPDIRTIDASGGLSRLGREAHPATRRASMASSQGPRGDSWSGVQRRGDALNRSAAGGVVGASVPEDPDEEGAEASAGGQKGSRPGTRGSGSSKSKQEDDDDRVDARNAASRLATSTF